MPTSHRINKYLTPPPLAPYHIPRIFRPSDGPAVVKLTSLVIIVACWQETILLMMSTTPASLYALVINALLFIGFYTKMRCPQIALTFSGDSSFEVQLLFIKTSQGCSECDLVCQFEIDLFYTLRHYTIYTIQKFRNVVRFSNQVGQAKLLWT